MIPYGLCPYSGTNKGQVSFERDGLRKFENLRSASDLAEKDEQRELAGFGRASGQSAAD